jgi:O-antigen ligase
MTIVAVTIVSCATVGILYSDALQTRVSDTGGKSINDREFFNEIGEKLAFQHPWFGVGVGNYVPAMMDAYKLEPWQHQPAHNIFIFIAAELGLVGLGLFLLILYLIFSKLKNVNRDYLSFSIVLVGVLFIGMGQLDHYFVTIQQGRLMFAVVMGLMAALPNLNDQNSMHNNQSNPKL